MVRRWVWASLLSGAMTLSGCFYTVNPPPSVAEMAQHAVEAGPSVAGYRVDRLETSALLRRLGQPLFHRFVVVDALQEVRWTVTCAEGAAASEVTRLARTCFFDSVVHGAPELELVLWSRPLGTYRGLVLRGGQPRWRVTSAVDPDEAGFWAPNTSSAPAEVLYSLTTYEGDVPVGVVLDGRLPFGSATRAWFAADTRDELEQLAPLALSLLVQRDLRTGRQADPVSAPDARPQDDAVALALLDQARAQRARWPKDPPEPSPWFGPDLRRGVDRWFLTLDVGAGFGGALDGPPHPDPIGGYVGLGLDLFDFVEGYAVWTSATWSPGLGRPNSQNRIGFGARLTLLRLDGFRVFAGYEATWNGTTTIAERTGGGVAGPTAGLRLRFFETMRGSSLDLKLELLAERAWFDVEDSRLGLSGRTSLQLRY